MGTSGPTTAEQLRGQEGPPTYNRASKWARGTAPVQWGISTQTGLLPQTPRSQLQELQPYM